MILRNGLGLLLCCSVAIVVLAFFSFPARSQSREDAPVSSESNIQWNARRVEHGGAVLHVLVPDSVSSDTIPLSVMLDNRGHEVFQVGETGYLLDCKVSVIGDDGNPISYSNEGASLFVNGEHSQYGLLRFSQGRTRHWQYDVAQALEPMKPGTYALTLDARIQFPDPDTNKFLAPVTISAKEISFTIPGI